MKKKSILALCALCACLLLSGCKPTVVGKWNVNTTLQNMPLRGTIEYKKDNTYSGEMVLQIGNNQIPVSITGTWKLEKKDGKYYLTDKPTSISAGGRNIPTGMLQQGTTSEVTFQKDSFTLSVGGSKITYTKAK